MNSNFFNMPLQTHNIHQAETLKKRLANDQKAYTRNKHSKSQLSSSNANLSNNNKNP